MTTKKKENPYAENYRRARLSVVASLKRGGLTYEEHEPNRYGELSFTVREDGHEVEVKICEAGRDWGYSTRDFHNAEQVTVKATRCTGRYDYADKTITYKLNCGAAANYDLKNEAGFLAGVKRQLQAKQDAENRRAARAKADKERNEQRAAANAVLKNAGVELGQEGPVALRTSRFGTQKYDIHIEGLSAVEAIEILRKIQPGRVDSNDPKAINSNDARSVR